MSCTHLSQDERYRIAHLHRREFLSREIGEHLDRDAATIRREVRRQTADDGRYDWRSVQPRNVELRRAARAQPPIDAEQRKQVEAGLRADGNPDQIVGSGEGAVSHERIHQCIADDGQCGVTLIQRRTDLALQWRVANGEAWQTMPEIVQALFLV